MQTIDVQQLAQLQQNGDIDLIDVRTPAEFRAVHAVGARNVPLDSLDPKSLAASRNGRSGEPLYVICRSGNRSGQAIQKFYSAGIDNVINVTGGTTAWDKAGLPVVRGKKAIALDRQMRILAGSLVLLGVVLSQWVAPQWIGLSAFIGAGLIYAGVTDTCPMSAMLARMPWNQCKDDSECCCG